MRGSAGLQVEAHRCAFYGNKAGGYGSVFVGTTAMLNVSHCSFANNSAAGAAAISCAMNSKVRMHIYMPTVPCDVVAHVVNCT
jgi:hypothetical protein